MKNAQKRQITLADVVNIIVETAQDTAPALVAIGNSLDSVGEETGIDILEKVGEGLQSVARITIDVLGLMGKDPSLRLIDTETQSRGKLAEQMIAREAFDRIKAK